MSESVIELISRGVLIHEGRLLVCRNRRSGYIFLPGGHVEFGESARMALTREMEEEVGTTMKAGRFMGACEAIFDQERRSNKGVRRHHEINLLFALLPTPDELARIASLEEKIEFDWLPVTDLAANPDMLLPGGIAAMVLTQKDVGAGWLSLVE